MLAFGCSYKQRLRCSVQLMNWCFSCRQYCIPTCTVLTVNSTYCQLYLSTSPSYLIPGGCCICLEQFAGVSTGIAVTASFSQQTEDRAFCPVVQLLWLRASHCTDYHVTSLLFLCVTSPCSLRTYATLNIIRSSSSSYCICVRSFKLQSIVISKTSLDKRSVTQTVAQLAQFDWKLWPRIKQSLTEWFIIN